MVKPKRLSGVARLVVEQAQRQEASEGAVVEAGGAVASVAVPVVVAAAASPAAMIFPRKGLGSVPAECCRPWALADRPEGEFEHVEELAKSLELDGQLQPAVVRPVQDPSQPEIRYEIIAGQARWRAAKRAGTPFRVLVNPELDDEAAFRAMVGENEFRLGLSDLARAKRFAAALDKGLYASKGEMAEKLRVSPSVLSAYLGFAKLDPVITAKLTSSRALSVRVGYQLYLASRDGFTDQIVRDLPKIESGEIGLKDIPDVWRGEGGQPGAEPNEATGLSLARMPARQFVGSTGRVLFALKTGAGGAASAVFDKGVSRCLDEAFWAEVSALVERRLG
ncbi:MAG: DNA-binding protein [Pseudomonadota bacterium]|jgi:ParB/RepB/Spo0J family partition protein